MRVVSLFAGIGGFDHGLARAGFTITDQVEREPFCQRVLAARFPHARQCDDVRRFENIASGGGGAKARIGLDEPCTLLCGGFPCQDLSVAGKRAGLAGERSGLFFEIVRIAKAVKPTWGLFENVPGLFSAGGGRDLATVLEGLRQCWPVVGYAVLDSQYFGVPQRRRRLFFVCGPTESGVEQILFESESGGRDSATGHEARTDLAASLRSRPAKPGVHPPGRGGEDDMNLVCAPVIGKPYGDQLGDESKLVVQALTNLGSGGPDDNEAQAGHLVVAQCHGSNVGPMGHLRSGNGTVTGGVPFVAHSINAHSGGVQVEATYLPIAGVRRLTPTECERLQGFPDLWTCLCAASAGRDWSVLRLPDEAVNRCTCPDGPRYKALGNAVTLGVIKWLGKRLAREVCA